MKNTLFEQGEGEAGSDIRECESSFEVISEEGQGDYEIFTCGRCGHSIVLAGTGGDVACCPCEFKHEGEN